MGKLSAGAMRTQRNRARIARGFHPFGMPLREPRGETCGSCAHMEIRRYSGTYFKCAKMGGGASAATDLRKSWPACTYWVARAALALAEGAPGEATK